MFKPLYLKEGRVLLRVDKKFYLDEKKKPVLDEKGEPAYDLEKTGTVLSSTTPELKKGAVVVPIIRGGVPIHSEETKKSLTIAIDVEDLYAVEI